MKVNVLRRLPVNLAFRDGDALEDGKRVLLHEGRQFAVLDQFADLAVGPAVRVIMAVAMLVDFAPVIMIVLLAVRMLVVLMPVFVGVPMFMLVLVFMLVGMSMAMLMLMAMGVTVRFPGTVLVRVFMLVGMGMRVPVGVLTFLVVMMVMPVAVIVAGVMGMAVIVWLVLAVGMRLAFVDAKFHPFHFLPLLPVEVHVKIANVELGKLPLERGRLNAEIDESADGHVAADSGKTIEEENFHGGETRLGLKERWAGVRGDRWLHRRVLCR